MVRLEMLSSSRTHRGLGFPPSKKKGKEEEKERKMDLWY
jgi:hypothetical protein